MRREYFSIPQPEVTLITRSLLLAVLMLGPATLAAQNPPKADSAGYPPKPAAPSFDFSGIIFANYQYRTEDAADDANKFDVERAYLTFRVSAGERTSVRITTDLYQQTSSAGDAFYRGWAVRAKYAYLQYNYLTGPALNAAARIGLLHTVFVEHDETFWPRWLGNSPTEKAGYFSSADAGIATSITLPKKAGEIYSTITNGPGYTSREIDRFKDFAARVTLTPFASNESSALRTVALTGWAYKGALASRFVTGGPGQVGTVGESLQRDRWGVHVGSATPRFTIAAQYAQRIEEGETGANTAASPRVVTDSTGTLASVYAIVRPFMLMNAEKRHPLSLIGRWDRVTTNDDTDAAYDFFVAGAIWDFTSRASISLDYQETTAARGNPIAHARTWFAHFVARF
jgi:hypothetical protein